MLNIPSIRIGKLFGIPIEVNLSWIAIFALVSLTLGSTYYPSIRQSAGSPSWLFALLGVLTALCFFASILIHELCHSLVTRAEGGHVGRITLFLFGGVSEIDEEPASPGREFLMAAAGPAMSFLLAVVFFALFAFATAQGAAWYVWAPLQYLALINLLVALFNMLPGFPLDGGRVLRSILWAITGDVLKATRWATRSGQFLGWGMVTYAVLGVSGVLSGQGNVVWFGLIGWFIAWMAGAAYRQQEVKSRLEGLTVDRIMTAAPETVPGDITVETLAHEHFLGGLHSRYPVMFEGAIHGIVSLADIKAIPRPDWPLVKVIDVANRDIPSLTVAPDAPASGIMARLAVDKPGVLLVVGDGRLVGIVTRADLISALQASAAQAGPPRR